MEKQVTNQQAWIKVKTSHGTEYVDAVTLCLFIRNSDTKVQPLIDKERETIISKLSPYCEGTIQSWETIRGYGARFSAPGYLDCTPWTVFDTATEAQEYLDSEDDSDESEEN